MFDRVLTRFRELVRTRCYVMTLHAEEEMDADELSLFDVENTILTGRIEERQKDRARGEWKYLVRGSRLDGDESVVVAAKLGSTGKLVILTVYVD